MKTNISRAIAKRHMTHEMVAEKLGITRQAVSHWSTGRARPSAERLHELAKLLNFSVDYLADFSSASGEPPEEVQPPAPDAVSQGKAGIQGVPEVLARVPVLDVYAACGEGAEPTSGREIGSLEFPVRFLRSLPGVAGISAIHAVQAEGDSMEPTIRDGAYCLVDGNQCEIRKDGIYCIQAENQIFIKRIQRETDGSITLLSDNPLYQPRAIGRGYLDSLCITGRVVHVVKDKEN